MAKREVIYIVEAECGDLKASYHLQDAIDEIEDNSEVVKCVIEVDITGQNPVPAQKIYPTIKVKAGS